MVILSQACFIKVAPYDKLVEEVDEAIQLLAEYSEAEPGVDRHPEAWLQEARLEGIKTLAKCRKCVLSVYRVLSVGLVAFLLFVPRASAIRLRSNARERLACLGLAIYAYC